MAVNVLGPGMKVSQVNSTIFPLAHRKTMEKVPGTQFWHLTVC